MLGGGFIGQMHETNKQNRELLKKNKRKPFEKQDYEHDESKLPLVDNKTFTNEDRIEMLKKLELDRRSENRKRLLILAVSIMVAIVFILMLKTKVFNFLTEMF